MWARGGPCRRYVATVLALPAMQGYVATVLALPAMQAWTEAALAEHDFLDFDEPYRSAPDAAR